MRLWLTRLATGLCLSLLCCVLYAQAAVPEHRGLWVGTAAIDTPEKVDATVARTAAAHLNAIYPLVWYNGGQAWFRSSYSPLADKVDPAFDPLGRLVEQAHARGIQVHAWFVSGSVGWADPGPLVKKHPDWLIKTPRQSDERWYDLAKPEVRQFETDLMIDCLRRYDVDGLHFDYIRYGDQGYCYCDYCQQEFAQRTGLPPLSAGGTRFPVALTTSGNPVSGPTAARVLATFSSGIPAIALNTLGKGEAALVNWQAVRPPNPAVDDTVLRLLQRFGAGDTNLYQLRTTPTTNKYGSEAQEAALAWVKQLGFKPQVIDETKLSQVPAGGTVFLYGQYYLPEETTQWLNSFVSAGGHALFVDGPVFAIGQPALQQVLGFTKAAPWFNGLVAITPATGQDFLASGPALDLETERTRLAEWVEYRKWTVTELVRAVREQARQVKPQAKLSAAVFYDRASADLVCQDWYKWLKSDLIDLALPMAYLTDSRRLQAALEEYRAADPQMTRIIPGLSLYMNEGGKAISRPRELVLSQVELSRKYGARGNLFFSIANLNDDLTEALATGPYKEPAPVYWP